MKEKLIIKNFGPIKSVELELGRFNVLIGENSTGKSTVAKVLASIYSLLNSTGERTLGLMRQSELSSISHFKKHLLVYKIDNYLQANSFINFYGKDIDFRLETGKIKYNYKELLEKDFLRNNTLTYIPADRIATSLFSSATWPALIDVEEGRIDMPKYFLRFINLFERLKKEREYDFTEILGIKFKQDDGIDKVILEDGTIISIQESASAIQANLSLSVIIDHQSAKVSTKKTFIIEEPELNLFPTAQNKLLQYLVDKTMNYGNSILLTTHSPYTVTSVNNLIYAYEVGQNHPEEVNNIINKKYWLNPADVKAYRLIEDESEKIIMDEEMKLIEAGEVDEISRSLNEIFDKISNVEYSTVSES